MRTWKNVALVAIVAVLGIVGFIACEDKDDDPNNDPVLIGSVGGIPVYRADGVSVADGATTLATINTAVEFGPDDMATLKAKVKSILIVSGNVLVWDGTILKIGVNETKATINGYMYDIIDGLI